MDDRDSVELSGLHVEGEVMKGKDDNKANEKRVRV